jgi:hypothetical protein
MPASPESAEDEAKFNRISIKEIIHDGLMTI